METGAMLDVQQYKNIHLLDTHMMGLDQFCGIYFLEGKKNVMIDAGPTASSAQVIDYLKKNKLVPHYIIITHNHYDHIGGVMPILDAFGAESITVVSNIIGRQRLKYPNDINHLFTEEILPSIEEVTVLDDGEYINIEGSRLRIIYTPGHSDDSISVYDEVSKTLFPGDLPGDWLWNKTYLSPHTTPDFSEEKYKCSVKKVSNLDISCTALAHYGFFTGKAAYEIFNQQLKRYQYWKDILVPVWKQHLETQALVPSLKTFFNDSPFSQMPNYDGIMSAFAAWCVMGYKSSNIIV